MKIVAYLRVSTQKQGQSGLGLEAQLSAINNYAATRGATIVETFTEVESGKSATRPKLAAAVHLGKVTGATVVIAKLDRLSRNAAFLLNLRDSGAKFIAADLPDANELTVGIMALVAQQEREAISKRTKEALGAAKARGVRLGNPNGPAALKRANKGNSASLRAIIEAADRHAENLMPVIQRLAEGGAKSLGAIATELNRAGMLTPRGARWHRSSVKQLKARIVGIQTGRSTLDACS
jgi:DNA invertase Pin-like site-specific DNA recombinase